MTTRRRSRLELRHALVSQKWFRRSVLAAAALVVTLGSLFALGVGIDMSFGPTFSTEPALVEPGQAHQERFGSGGSTDVVLLVDVGDLANRDAAVAVVDLAGRLGQSPAVAAVVDPTAVSFYDQSGAPVPTGLRDTQGQLLPEPTYGERLADLAHSAPLRRLLIADDLGTVVVSATLADADNFASRRDGVQEVRSIVDDWTIDTGYVASITGFPEIEAVYAFEIMTSVLIVIAVLYLIVSVLLVLYLRDLRLAAIAVSGVTLAMPLTLAGMRLLGQPFSIVNSQVLTLVAIVGIAHGLHQVDGYRKARIANEPHPVAFERAAETLWPSIATGLTTIAGFLALAMATMPAVRSFGFSTAVGVAIVYVLNAALIPVFLESMAEREIKPHAPLADLIAWILRTFANLGRDHATKVIVTFVGLLTVFAAIGIPRLDVDQRVTEELPLSHATRQAQKLHEDELSGYLGPNIWLRGDTDLLAQPESLASFVNGVCALEGVLHVASPLDLVPQDPIAAGNTCTRAPQNLLLLREAGTGPEGSVPAATNGLVGQNVADGITVRVRTADFGTARALELLAEIDDLAAATLGDGVQADAVGDWVLAQNGMDQLSNDVGLSAGFALLIVVPMIGAALRNIRMFMASLLPTVLPVIATLAFLGVTGITLRIGTAMILAICLGLAADDTIYIFTDVRRNIDRGLHPSDAIQAALMTSGPPALFSSIVLVAGLLSMTLNQLLVLRDMGIVAAFTMTFAVLNDLLLGPAVYHTLHRSTSANDDHVEHHDAVVVSGEDRFTSDLAALPTARLEAVMSQTVELRLPIDAAVADELWLFRETDRIALPIAPTESQPAEPTHHLVPSRSSLLALSLHNNATAVPDHPLRTDAPSFPVPDRAPAEPLPELQVTP